MEIYKEAYQYYKRICEKFGMQTIPFRRFVHNLTEEQLQMYIQKANGPQAFFTCKS